MDEQIAALDPIDTVYHIIRAVTDELIRSVDNLAEADGGENLKLRVRPEIRRL